MKNNWKRNAVPPPRRPTNIWQQGVCDIGESEMRRMLERMRVPTTSQGYKINWYEVRR